MTPCFFGIGEYQSWEGVGVARDGGEGRELFRTIAWLAVEHGGIKGLFDFALSERSGWSSLLWRKPLTEQSGVYPFHASTAIYQAEFAGGERGVFLTHDFKQIEVWKGEVLQATIQIKDSRPVILWADGSTEFPNKSREFEEWEDRPSAMVLTDSPPKVNINLQGAIRRQSVFPNTALYMAIRNAIFDVVPSDLSTTDLYLVASHNLHSKTQRSEAFAECHFRGLPLKLDAVSDFSWHLCRFSDEQMAWDSLKETMAFGQSPRRVDFSFEGTWSDQKVPLTKVKDLFNTLLMSMHPEEHSDLEWTGPKGRRRLLSTNGREDALRTLTQQLLYWAKDPKAPAR